MQVTIKAARINSGMKQTDVAKKMNVTPVTISNWEIGKTIPNADQFIELSKLYNVPIECLKLH